MLCCRLSFVTHWGGTTYFRLKCRSRSCCRCRQCAWTGLSGWTPTAGIYGGGALLFLLILLLSSAGRSGVTPMKVTLCGVALSAFVSSITAAILILDEQTLLAMRTWLAGDLAGQDWATLGTSALVFSGGGFVLALYLAPSLNMLALGDRMAQGAGRLCTPHANIHPACDRVALWRSRIDCWPHWFCRPASTADCPASGISGSARSAPSFSLCRRAFCYYWQILLPGRFSRPMS